MKAPRRELTTAMTDPRSIQLPTSHRLSRLRRKPALRDLVREESIEARQLVLPVFVSDVDAAPREISSMPGVSRWPVDRVHEIAQRVDRAGLGGLLLFGIPAEKDPAGSGASAADGVVQRAAQLISSAGFGRVIMADVCLCEYTDHGHCGLLDAEGRIRNDETLVRLADTAVSLARAGVDVVAPSGMMDGQVMAIRNRLDEVGFHEVAILSYSAKYASAFYGPFREAADGAPQFGDRRTHQMDPANTREAMREHGSDLDEGADILMVKPGIAYLDVLARTRDAFPNTPLAAYNVSGEYSMTKAASAAGWIDERAIVLETLLAFRRAGADFVITYHALEAAEWMQST